MLARLMPILAMIVAACQVAPGQVCAPTADEARLWGQASRTGTHEAYRGYLAKYPQGCYSSTAALRLRQPVGRVTLAAGVSGGGSNGVASAY